MRVEVSMQVCDHCHPDLENEIWQKTKHLFEGSGYRWLVRSAKHAEYDAIVKEIVDEKRVPCIRISLNHSYNSAGSYICKEHLYEVMERME